MSAPRRIVKGIGSETNPTDGDHVVIELGLRNGKIAYVGENSIRTGITTFVADEAPKHIEFRTGMQAKVHGETFAGCETARNAALALHKVFIGRGADESLSISVTDLIAKMDAPPEDERCVRAVLAAVRKALIDVQVTVLAETIVEARTLRDTA